MSIFDLYAEVRTNIGKGASRRLRREAKVPAILYGGKEAPINLELSNKHVMKALSHESVFSHMLNLHVGNETITVVLRDAQAHPYKSLYLHLDFQRINANDAITMHVPLHIVGEAKSPGMSAGGILTRLETTVEVRCLPMHLPEFISVDVSTLGIDGVLHFSDLKLPHGTTLANPDNDAAILSIHKPSQAEEIENGAPTAPVEVPASKAKAPAVKVTAEAKPKKKK